MTYLTDEEKSALQQSDLPGETPFMFGNVTPSQLSIARYSMGCRYNGSVYEYIPQTDELIREDVMKWIKNFRASIKKGDAPEQNDIFQKYQKACQNVGRTT